MPTYHQVDQSGFTIAAVEAFSLLEAIEQRIPAWLQGLNNLNQAGNVAGFKILRAETYFDPAAFPPESTSITQGSKGNADRQKDGGLVTLIEVEGMPLADPSRAIGAPKMVKMYWAGSASDLGTDRLVHELRRKAA